MVYRTTERGERIRAATRRRLLRAAGKLFAARGYDATTMQDIVALADTSIGNAYFYFKNKETLMHALVEETANAVFESAEAHARHLPPGPERIAAIVAYNTTTFLTARRDMVRALTADQHVATIGVIGDVAATRWIPILAESLPDRPRTELPLVAAAIWGANRAIVERAARGAPDMPTKEVVMFMVKWMLRALDLTSVRAEAIAASAWRRASRDIRKAEVESW